MQTELFRNAPGANPFLHGFADLSIGDRRIIGHGGDTFWFHSQLSLLPEHDLGIFVSFNTEGGSAGTLVADFLDRYFGESDALPSPIAGVDLDRFEGTFRSNRFSHTDFTKVAALAGEVSVASDGDTALLIDMGVDQRWVAVEPLVFQSTASDRQIAFREDDRGRITHAFLADVPYLGLERVPWSERARVHLPLALGAGILFVLAVVGIPVPWYFRRKYDHQPEDVIPGVGTPPGLGERSGVLDFSRRVRRSNDTAQQRCVGRVGWAATAVPGPAGGCGLGRHLALDRPVRVAQWKGQHAGSGRLYVAFPGLRHLHLATGGLESPGLELVT